MMGRQLFRFTAFPLTRSLYSGSDKWIELDLGSKLLGICFSACFCLAMVSDRILTGSMTLQPYFLLSYWATVFLPEWRGPITAMLYFLGIFTGVWR